MAHHKRKRPKSRRAGCLLCKPHKANGCRHSEANLPPAERRRLVKAREQVAEAVLN